MIPPEHLSLVIVVQSRYYENQPIAYGSIDNRHGFFILKRLRLSFLNEMHTNSFTGPRLL